MQYLQVLNLHERFNTKMIELTIILKIAYIIFNEFYGKNYLHLILLIILDADKSEKKIASKYPNLRHNINAN